MGWGVAAAALVGGIASYAGSTQTNAMGASESGRVRAWQKDMYKRRYQMTVKDMKKAGLNPMLAYAQGAGSVPSGAMASFQNPAAAGVSSAVDAYEAGIQGEAADAEIQKKEQEVRNLESAKDLTDEQVRAMTYTIAEIQSRIDLNASTAQGVDYENVKKSIIAHWVQSNESSLLLKEFGIQPQTAEKVITDYFSRFMDYMRSNSSGE